MEDNKNENINNEESNDSKDIKDETTKVIDDITDVIKDITDNLGQDAKEQLGSAEELTGLIKDKLEDTMSSIGEEFKDKYFKVLAEMENLRKRFENDKVDVMKYRASSFIQQILPTVDMFESAMSASNVSDEVKNWLVGFEMILNNFKTVLAAEGVKAIETNKGDLFNSEFHMAIDQVESDQEPGTIVDVKVKGYMLHDRLLRPASVTVAKKASTEDEAPKEDTEVTEGAE